AGTAGRHVTGISNDDRVHEMFVKMIDVFGDTVFHRSGNGDVIEHRKVLHVFAKTHAAGMRAHGQAEFGGHQDDCEILIYSAKAAAIDLHEIDAAGLHELLEEDSIGTVFAGCHTHRINGLGDCRVAQDIVWIRWFLDPPWAEFRKSLHGSDGFAYIPSLIGVHHELVVRPDFATHDCSAANIIIDIAADLHFEICPA